MDAIAEAFRQQHTDQVDGVPIEAPHHRYGRVSYRITHRRGAWFPIATWVKPEAHGTEAQGALARWQGQPWRTSREALSELTSRMLADFQATYDATYGELLVAHNQTVIFGLKGPVPAILTRKKDQIFNRLVGECRAMGRAYLQIKSRRAEAGGGTPPVLPEWLSLTLEELRSKSRTF